MSAVWSISEDIVWTSDTSGVRLYQLSSGDFHALNGAATTIWRLIADGLEEREILGQLISEYGNGEESEAALITRDFRQFVSELVGKGVLACEYDDRRVAPGPGCD